MLFNSLDFTVFLPIVFILYWFVTNKNLKIQNILIVISSYIFYGWWDWRFLFLILFSSILDYLIGLALLSQENNKKRTVLLWVSMSVNLGLLGYFKYFNFFIDSFKNAFSFFGQEITISSLDIILPVGISFYTFQTMSYTIDVYKRNLEPTKDFVAFMAFVSFFPQLVAGPIERATNLLPQICNKRTFDYNLAVQGLKQMLWGFFKKIVIADNCAQYANLIFNNSDDYSGSTLLLGAVFFTFQIYGDFSGYSDIAIGLSRLFGFDLMKNFAFPYFSRDVAEFWRRWHISLSTWFRDYLYIPLGGSQGNTLFKVRNTFIIFIVSGFWHGANWTFIFWGLLNALFIMPSIIFSTNRKNINIVAQGKYFPTLRELTSILLTFSLTVLTWIFFRAENITHAFTYISDIFKQSLFYAPTITINLYFIIALLFFIVIEWIGREGEFALNKLFNNSYKPVKWVFYYLIIFAILYFAGPEQQFIYFQF